VSLRRNARSMARSYIVLVSVFLYRLSRRYRFEHRQELRVGLNAFLKLPLPSAPRDVR
jgi:hypothetical protein